MSPTSLQSFSNSYSPFSSVPPRSRMSLSQTPGLDTLAEGSQYALEQLQLARGASTTSSDHPTNSTAKTPNNRPSQQLLDENNGSGFKNRSQSRDSLAEARSTIRKNSSATPVRRRISRACDQCNHLRTKCDGQLPCAHCIGMLYLDTQLCTPSC